MPRRWRLHAQSVESLTMLADDVLLDKRVEGCSRFPEGLPRLSSLVLPRSVRGSGFSSCFAAVVCGDWSYQRIAV